MNILHLGYADSSGVPSRWAAAHRSIGHETRLLFEREHEYRYDDAATIRRWTIGSDSASERADLIRDELEWADVVMAYDHPFYLDAAIASGRPVLFRALGTAAREHSERLHELLRSPVVLRASTGLAELADRFAIELVGAPYPLLDPVEPTERLVACHAPSDRELKQTAVVLETTREAGWEVAVCEEMANAEVLAHKRAASLVIDSAPGAVPDGYGVNSVEAMALGLPALAGATAKVKHAMARVGSPVILAETIVEFRWRLIELKNPDTRRRLGEAGRDFVARFHNPIVCAEQDMLALSARAAA